MNYLTAFLAWSIPWFTALWVYAGNGWIGFVLAFGIAVAYGFWLAWRWDRA